MAKKKPREPKVIEEVKWEPSVDLLNHVKTCAAIGLNDKEIAARVGVPIAQFMENPDHYALFVSNVEVGRASGTAAVAKKLWEKAKEGDFQCMKLYLTHVAKWAPASKEDKVVDQSNISVVVYVPEKMPMDQWAKLAAETVDAEVEETKLIAAPPELKVWAQQAANAIEAEIAAEEPKPLAP